MPSGLSETGLGSDMARESENLFLANRAAALPIEIRAWKNCPMVVRLRELRSLARENML
jgi:hypothetical protein